MSVRHVQIMNSQQIILVPQQCAFPPLAQKSPRLIESKYADAKQDKDMQIKQPTNANQMKNLKTDTRGLGRAE